MGGVTTRSRWDRVNLVALVFAGGCQTSSSLFTSSLPQPMSMSIGERRVSQQFIIKFKPNTIACDAPELAHLSAVTRVPLEYVRPMSGDACVIKQLADNAVGLSHGQETLKQHPAIEWLEEDKMMKAL